MTKAKRLRSLDEFRPLPWHVRQAPQLFSWKMILGIVAAMAAGTMIGLNI